MKNHTENDVTKKTMQEQDTAEKTHTNTKEANKELDASSLDQVVGGFATVHTHTRNDRNYNDHKVPLGNP